MEEPTQQNLADSKQAAGLHRVTIIWEVTQAIIALLVTGVSLYIAGRLTLTDPTNTTAFVLLSNAFFLVIGFYFSRKLNGNGKG